MYARAVGVLAVRAASRGVSKVRRVWISLPYLEHQREISPGRECLSEIFVISTWHRPSFETAAHNNESFN